MPGVMQNRKKYDPSHLIRRLVPLYLLLVLVMWGCASTPGVSATASESTRAPDIESRLRQAARTWRHTPHRMGGLDKRGIDCSGLAQVIYKDLFGIKLPRTTGQQVHRGVPVKRAALAAGDLVFFRPPGKKGHVGIYLGQGEFLHTSTRRGVMISHMEEDYWHQCYWTARRVLKPEFISN